MGNLAIKAMSIVRFVAWEINQIGKQEYPDDRIQQARMPAQLRDARLTPGQMIFFLVRSAVKCRAQRFI